MSEPAPEGSGESLDCQSCGACCHAQEGTVLVTEEDILRFRAAGRSDLIASLEPGHFSMQAFAMPSGACEHLQREGARWSCGIYSLRAESCRLLVPGTSECRSARRRLGLES